MRRPTRRASTGTLRKVDLDLAIALRLKTVATAPRLSLRYDIVTKGHGGTLNVESIEGQGTEMCIQLTV